MESEPTPAASPDAVAKAQARWRPLSSWVARLSPWASLLLSTLGAAYMDRRQEQGSWIVGWAALGFVALVVLGVTHRTPSIEPSQRGAQIRAVVRFTTAATSQSLVQTCLFFSGPFYLEACAFTPAQCLFGVAFVLAIVVSSWDPWCVRALLHPLLGPLISAFSSFVAWNAALPMLGMQHRQAVWLAAGLVSVLVPAVYLMRGTDQPHRVQILVAGALAPLMLATFGVRALPAAPLKVVDAGIGTGIAERALVGRAQHFDTPPAKLWCYSAIFAPRALHDDLVHVWSRDGVELSRIPLAVRGGRKLGFRTWSYQPLSRWARGHYSCRVLTQFGQTLGAAEVTVGRH